jgi:Rieske Fe-S protein
VPVGGGAIFPDDELVVTQPTKGEFKAFTAICTHQGCLVNKVEDEQIVCPCHGSHFSITDGAPVAGPASAPLAARKVAVKGTRITVT